LNFLKSLEFWRNIMDQICNWKCMVSEQSYMSARKWSLVVNSHLHAKHPFLAVGGLMKAQRAPVQEHVTPFNTAGYLPVAHGGHSCSPPSAFRGAHKQSVQCSRGKIVLALKNSWAVLVNAPLQREKRNCCSTAAVVALYGHPPKLPRNTL
jgi:hypothetical protein